TEGLGDEIAPPLLDDALGGTGVAGLDLAEPRIAIRLELGLAAAAAGLVQDTIVGDLQKPGANGSPLRIEAVRPGPHAEEPVLHDVLGGRAVEGLDREGEHGSGEPAVQRAEGALGAAGNPTHQLGVTAVLAREHVWRSVHPRLLRPRRHDDAAA